jgi:hypothetical protein
MPASPPFGPSSTTTSLAASSASANTALPTGSGFQFRIVNDGTQTVYFKAGQSGVTADATATPLLANSTGIFTLDPNATTIAVYANTSGSTLRITRGEGA